MCGENALENCSILTKIFSTALNYKNISWNRIKIWFNLWHWDWVKFCTYIMEKIRLIRFTKVLRQSKSSFCGNSNVFNSHMVFSKIYVKSTAGWPVKRKLISRNFPIKLCTVYSTNYRNYPSHFFRKKFVKAMVLLKKLLNSWFDEIFSVWQNFSFFHIYCALLWWKNFVKSIPMYM